MTFTKKSGVRPDELLDQEKVQDFDANASYIEVSMRPGFRSLCFEYLMQENETLEPSWSFHGENYSVGGIKIRRELFTCIMY